MNGQSGLSSGSSRDSVAHSNKSSKTHKQGVAAGGRKQYAGTHSVVIDSCGEAPEFSVKKGDLECDGFPHALWIPDEGINKASYMTGNHFEHKQMDYIHDCVKVGIYRTTRNLENAGPMPL